MADPETHEIDELEDDQDDALETPADTPKGDEPKKETAEDVAERQALSWADNISKGKKTLEDLPENMGWLKDKIQEKLPEPAKVVEQPKKAPVDIDEAKIATVLEKREAKKGFENLVLELQDAGISAEQDADLKEVYEDLIGVMDANNPEHQLKALQNACRSVGIKDKLTQSAERRRQGSAMIPLGGQRRKVQAKEEVDDEVTSQYKAKLKKAR